MESSFSLFHRGEIDDSDSVTNSTGVVPVDGTGVYPVKFLPCKIHFSSYLTGAQSDAKHFTGVNNVP